MKPKIEVVIPTRNDYLFLEKIITTVLKIPEVEHIFVIDNCSDPLASQKIKKICAKFKPCFYFFSSIEGKGNAIRLGISQTQRDVLFLDADVENLSEEHIKEMYNSFSDGLDVVKAKFSRENGQSNSSFVLKEIKRIFPGLRIAKPTGGIYLVKRTLLEKVKIPEKWSVDLSILLQAYKLGAVIGEVDMGLLKDKKRSQSSLEESKILLQQELLRFGGQQ